MKNALFILIIVCSRFYLSAQTLHLAQDIGHCAFGLKNDSDQWVVKPAYAQLQPTKPDENQDKGWIFSFDGLRFGLMDKEGHVLFRPLYSSIRFDYKLPEKNIYFPQPQTKVDHDSSLAIYNYPHYLKTDGLIYFYYPQSNGYKKEHHVGFADSAGNVLTEKSYYSIEEFHNGRACFSMSNGKIGYLNKKGVEIIPANFNFEQISPPTNYGVYVHNDSLTGFFRWSDGGFSPMKMAYVFDPDLRVSAYTGTMIAETIFIGKTGNKYGYLDDRGTIFIEAIYDTIEKPVNGISRVVKNGKIGLMNDHGKILLQAECESMERFTMFDAEAVFKNHCLIFYQNGKCGIFSDSKGIIMKPSFSSGGWFQNDSNVFWGLKGKQVHTFKIEKSVVTEIPFQKLQHRYNSDSTIILGGFLQTVLVDRNGKLIGKPLPWMELEDDGTTILPSGFHAIQGKNGYGIISFNSSDAVVPPIYKSAGTFGNFLHSGFGWDDYNDGFLYVETYGGHYGVYAVNGKLIVDTIYTSMNMISMPDSCWSAQIKKDGDWYLINSKGKIIAVSEKRVWDDNHLGKYIVTRHGHEDLFDVYTEKYIVENKYSHIESLPENIFIVTNDSDKAGLMDSLGNLIFPCQYSKITSPVNRMVLLFSDNGEAVADLSGKIISPFSKIPLAFRAISFDTIFNFRDYIIAENPTDFPEDDYSVLYADTTLHFKSCRIANNFLADSLCGISSGVDHSEEEWQTIMIGQENTYYENDRYSGTKYSIPSLTPVSFSVTKYYYETGRGGYYDEYSVNNYIIRNDSTVHVGLYDVLRNNISYETINDTIRATIGRQNDEFFFDCSNPRMLSPDYFTIDTAGISVMYVNKNEALNDENPQEDIFSHMQTVVLPWSLIGKYLKPGTDLQKLYAVKH